MYLANLVQYKANQTEAYSLEAEESVKKHNVISSSN